jgi:hypothetical protein
MTKYIVIYHADAATMAGMQDMSPEQMAEGMKPWMAWAEACGDGLVDMGSPLGGGVNINAGGSSPSGKEVTGYSILEADSMQAAEALMQGHPHLAYGVGCEIEIHEAMPLPGS